MVRTFLWRLASACATLLILVAFAFFSLKAAPHGPYDAAPAVSPERLPGVAATFDPAQPAYQQFGRYLWNALHLDFGASFLYRDYTVAELLLRGAPVTIETIAWGLSLATPLGVLPGVVAWRFRHSWFCRGLSVLATIWLIVPLFLLAMLFQFVFVIDLHWFPAAGWDGSWQKKALPVVTLALPVAVMVGWLVRRRLSDADAADLGMRRRFAVALDAIAARLGALVSFAVVLSFPLERAFSLPGSGRYVAVAAGQHRDFPLLSGALLFYGGMIVLISLGADLARIALGLAREEPPIAGEARLWTALRRDKVVWAGAALALAAACFGPPALYSASLNPDFDAIRTAPSLSSGHLLGADELGRDTLWQLLFCLCGSIRLALEVGAIAGAFLAVWRFAAADNGFLRRWGEMFDGVLDAAPFLLLGMVLGSWWLWPGMACLVWLVLWLAVRGRCPLPLAICAAIPASIIGDAYLGSQAVGASEPPMTLGSLLVDGMHNIEFAPGPVLAAVAGMLFLTGLAALLAVRMRGNSAPG